MKYYIALLLFSIALSCNQSNKETGFIEDSSTGDFKLDYAFFVAGHAYGHPSEKHVGLHTPFVNQIPFINKYPNMEFGILTGDVVRRSTQAYWDSVQVDIGRFSIPIYIAAGNHDRGEIFESLYPYYQSFWREDDLFIILSPTDWNIEGEQKDFLVSKLDNAKSKANNVFIFCHELVWWSPKNEFKNLKINYKPHYPGSSNYWSEISPILEAYSNNIVVYVGDLGATDLVDSYMYHAYNNITLIASGMGGHKADNIVITEVASDGDIRFRLLRIDENPPVELADLKAFKLP